MELLFEPKRKLLTNDSDILYKNYDQIMKITDNKKKVNAVRTRELYLILKLYNVALRNTFKVESINIKGLKDLLNT